MTGVQTCALPISKLIEGNQIGQGAFGVVHKADWDGLAVAVKSFRSKRAQQGSNYSEKDWEDFEREGKILEELKHPNIVQVRLLIFFIFK